MLKTSATASRPRFEVRRHASSDASAGKAMTTLVRATLTRTCACTRRLAVIALASAATLFTPGVGAQEVQRLYQGKAPGSEGWTLPEAVRAAPDGGKVYTNVVDPEFAAYLPDPAQANGTGVILLPGGGLRQLHVGAEAAAMIKRFNADGIAVFVLKYRVNQVPSQPPRAAPTSGASAPSPNGRPELPKLVIRNANANPAPNDKKLAQVLEFAAVDAKTALRMIRAQAAKYRIDPHRIGMIGSSAGGGVAIAALLGKGQEEGPAFIGLLYGPSLMDVVVPENAPPLFMATETAHGPVTDGLVALFGMWKDAKRPVEMHVYDVPNFAMPPSLWLPRFMDWMHEQKLVRPEADRSLRN